MRALAALLLLALACSPGDESATAAADAASWDREGVGGVAIRAAYAPAPPSDTAAVYLLIEDTDGAGDRLVAARCAEASQTMLHRTRHEGGPAGHTRMEPASGGIPVPPGGRAVLGPGGAHVMLMGLSRRPAVGEELEVELLFERAGPVAVRAAVIDPAETEARAAGPP